MIETPSVDIAAMLPELVTAIGAIIVLLMGLSSSRIMRNAVSGITLLALALAFGWSVIEFDLTRTQAIAGQITADSLANIGRIIAAGAGFIAALFAIGGRPDDNRHGEFHALLLACVCGMGLFAAAGSLVTLFVGLELFSIALYVMVALEAERTAALEAGLKYLVLGGLASAVLLYGSALVYGATGSLSLAAIGASDTSGMLLAVGAVLMLIGFAFKISAAPLHWWTPDVYEGSSTIVTAFMSVATKAVAFIAFARVMVTALDNQANIWVPMLAVVAALSIAVGNFAGLVQSRLKRMLAYSSIAQAGYLAMGIVAYDTSGIPALMFALLVYSVMTLGAFAYVITLERTLGREATFADLSGRGWLSENLGKKHHEVPPWLTAFAMAICMLALAGIPPTAGFFSKLTLFSSSVDSGYAWLAVVAAIGSVISLGYYLRVIVELYMRVPDSSRAATESRKLPAPSTAKTVPAASPALLVGSIAVALAVGTLALSILPSTALDAGCRAGQALNSGTCFETAATAGAATDNR